MGNRQSAIGNRQPTVVGEVRIESHRDLRVWQAAMTLAEECYAVTKDFPDSERFGMTSQIRRASVSIAANIAEGYGRDSTGSYVQFLKTAQGSVKELETLLEISQRVGLVANTDRHLESCDGIGRMLRALIRRLQAR
jgi:four helix bundle protein